MYKYWEPRSEDGDIRAMVTADDHRITISVPVGEGDFCSLPGLQFEVQDGRLVLINEWKS